MADNEDKVKNTLQITSHPFYSSEEAFKKIEDGYPFILTKSSDETEDYILTFKGVEGHQFNVSIRVTDAGFQLGSLEPPSESKTSTLNTYKTLDELINKNVPPDNFYFALNSDGKLIIKNQEKVKEIVKSELENQQNIPNEVAKRLKELYTSELSLVKNLSDTLKVLEENQDKFYNEFGKKDRDMYDKIKNNFKLAHEVYNTILKAIKDNIEPLSENTSDPKPEEFQLGMQKVYEVLQKNIPKLNDAINFYLPAATHINGNEKMGKFLTEIFKSISFADRYIQIIQRPMRYDLLFNDYKKEIMKLASSNVARDLQGNLVNFIKDLETLDSIYNPNIRNFNHVGTFRAFVKKRIRQSIEEKNSSIFNDAAALVAQVGFVNQGLNQYKGALDLKEYIESNRPRKESGPGIKLRHLDKSVDIMNCFAALKDAVSKRTLKIGDHILEKNDSVRMENGDIIIRDSNGYDLIRISLQSMSVPNPSHQKKMKLCIVNDDKRKMTDLNIETISLSVKDIVTTLQNTALKDKNMAQKFDFMYVVIKEKSKEEPKELKKLKKILIELASKSTKKEANKVQEEQKGLFSSLFSKKNKKDVAIPQSPSIASTETILKSVPSTSEAVVEPKVPLQSTGVAKEENTYLKEAQKALENLQKLKDAAFKAREKYIQKEKDGYVFFRQTSERQWNSEVKAIQEKYDKLQDWLKKIPNFDKKYHEKFFSTLNDVDSLTKKLKSAMWKLNNDGPFVFGRELMKMRKKSKISADCKTFEGYYKLSEASLKEVAQLAASSLYEGVAYKKTSNKEGRVEIIVPPIAENMPPSGIVRTYNKDVKKAEILLNSSTDKAILIALDTSNKFAPLVIEVPRDKMGKNPVSEDKIDKEDVDFVLKTFVASKIRGVPVKLDESYKKILEKQYPEACAILEKIEQTEFKKEDIEDKSLDEIVREIGGEKPKEKPGGSIYQNK